MIVEPAMWKEIVLRRDAGCLLHDDLDECEWPFQAHHVVTSQQLRKRGLRAYLWDTRNGIALCYKAHRRHHSAHTRIPFELLPAEAHEFAAEHDLEHLIARYYPRTVAA